MENPERDLKVFTALVLAAVDYVAAGPSQPIVRVTYGVHGARVLNDGGQIQIIED